MTALGGRIRTGNKGSCCCSVPAVGASLPGARSAAAALGRGRWDGDRNTGGILGIVLWFMAEMPPGQSGLNLAACGVGIPRSSSRGVKYIEVMQENTLLLFYRASRAVSEMGEGRGASCPKIKGEEETYGACEMREACY